MKFLFDLFPILLFFVAFKFYGIYAATATAIIATILQIIYSKIRTGRVEKSLLVSGFIITLFGGATLFLHDETFIKWKPTILYWVFALALILSPILFKKNLIKSMMEKQVNAPNALWQKLSWAWGLFFAILGCINLYVAFHYSTATWVNFKLFGTMGLMFLFIIAQGLVLSPYMITDDDASNDVNK